MPQSLEPLTIDVPQDVLDDLQARLRATRFAAGLDNEDEFYGLSTAYVRPLVEYWADGFDWRAAEKQLNSFRQYRIAVGGTPVHFIREPGRARLRSPSSVGEPGSLHHRHPRHLLPLADRFGFSLAYRIVRRQDLPQSAPKPPGRYGRLQLATRLAARICVIHQSSAARI